MSNAVTQLVDALTREITLGNLAPGQRLSQADLAHRFEVSRTPVREAIAQLVARGVLEDRGRNGTYVATIGDEDLSQMLEAMNEIEALCASLAARRMSLLLRSDLEAAQSRCRAAAEAQDVPGFLEANRAFHLIIYKGTQNRFVEETALSFRLRTDHFRGARFRNPAELLKTVAEHDRILALIELGDGARAMEEMRSHITLSHMRILAGRGASKSEKLLVSGDRSYTSV